MRTYTEMITIPTFDGRLNYLMLMDRVGDPDSFCNDRWILQKFYQSYEWQKARQEVIVRDNGFDLGLKDFCISGRILVHHINPITRDDVISGNPKIFDLDNLICVSHNTHNAIHYAREPLVQDIKRTANDTCPWKE